MTVIKFEFWRQKQKLKPFFMGQNGFEWAGKIRKNWKFCLLHFCPFVVLWLLCVVAFHFFLDFLALIAQQQTMSQRKAKSPVKEEHHAQLTDKQRQELADLKKPVAASEFGGVGGITFLTFALPIVIYWIWASLEFNDGYLLRPKVCFVASCTLQFAYTCVHNN